MTWDSIHVYIRPSLTFYELRNFGCEFLSDMLDKERVFLAFKGPRNIINLVLLVRFSVRLNSQLI